MQLERDGILGKGEVNVIARLPSTKGLLRMKSDSNKIWFGPKFAFNTFGTKNSFLVTDEPMLASCSQCIMTENLEEAEKLRLFAFNNKILDNLSSRLNVWRLGDLLSIIQKFDLNQIKDGSEIPKEWNLSKEDLEYLNVG
jgi:hypothetical protein